MIDGPSFLNLALAIAALEPHFAPMIVQHLGRLPWEEVSHNPAIKKRVILRSGQIDSLTQLAQARFAPGQSAPAHSHPDMVEVFLVTAGTATAMIDGKRLILPTGSCLVVEAGEHHELRNDGDHDLILTYFSIRTSPKSEI